MSVFAQSGFRVRVDWGLAGAMALTAEHPERTAVVVVDVLSFSTAVSVAVDTGIEVFPYRWRDESADLFAAEHDAELARGRSSGGLSLSPASIRTAAATGLTRRVVLPSPNGATICSELAQHRVPMIIAGCLRNTHAVAAVLDDALRSGTIDAVAVIAAGERWPDGALRPAIEDLWGTGAVVAALAADGRSPEAHAAARTVPASDDVAAALVACASGRELVGYGFPDDVAIAAELATSALAPVLTDGRFVPFPSGE